VKQTPDALDAWLNGREIDKSMAGEGEADLAVQDNETNIGFKPLYAQVKEKLIGRLVDGTWQPGTNLPSEQELARQLNVSQGTVRKALDSMTTENLLVRRQGRGTFVAEPEDARILFQFFRLTADDTEGRGAFPDSRLLNWSQSTADEDQADALSLKANAPVWCIERIRLLRGKPLLTESITIPVDKFPGFGDLDEIPNNVYQLYSSRWGITIAKADERLKAVTADAEDARDLGCQKGEPLLLIRRIARDLEGNPVELRTSRCLTQDMHYAANLP
jgi:GntR family transcriptional regulator